jgi:hypothetical protein
MLLEKPVPGYGNLRLFVYSIIKKPRMSADVDKNNPCRAVATCSDLWLDYSSSHQG